MASPAVGVERRMLFRIGEEKARATSIVRYAPGSRFARHGHPGGEEFLVLEGTFQDETGDFPAGTYVRNPPGTAHAPGSETGCTILVKLWQFEADDRVRIVRRPGEGERADLRSGVSSSLVLFERHRHAAALELAASAVRRAAQREGRSGGRERLVQVRTASSWKRVRVRGLPAKLRI